MIRPVIYAKTALDRSQLTDRISRGASGIELQLLPDNYKNGDFNADREAIRDFSPFIQAIHLPIDSCDITDVPDNLSSIGKTINSFYIDKKLVVIFHLMNSAYRLDYVRRSVEDSMKTLFTAFPKLEIAIENTTPYDNGDKLFRNAFHFETVEFVENMKWMFGDKVGTVLDTCHAMISLKYMQHMNGLYPSVEPAEYTMEKFFEANRNTCKIIHLSSIDGNGLGMGHGVSLHDAREAGKFLDLYNRYGYTAGVTIEVYEDDFAYGKNFSTTSSLIDDASGRQVEDNADIN